MITITTKTKKVETPIKVGGLNKAKKAVRINNIRENLETSFIKKAEKMKFKETRSDKQRNDRKAKRNK